MARMCLFLFSVYCSSRLSFLREIDDGRLVCDFLYVFSAFSLGVLMAQARKLDSKRHDKRRGKIYRENFTQLSALVELVTGFFLPFSFLLGVKVVGLSTQKLCAEYRCHVK